MERMMMLLLLLLMLQSRSLDTGSSDAATSADRARRRCRGERRRSLDQRDHERAFEELLVLLAFRHVFGDERLLQEDNASYRAVHVAEFFDYDGQLEIVGIVARCGGGGGCRQVDHECGKRAARHHNAAVVLERQALGVWVTAEWLFKN